MLRHSYYCLCLLFNKIEEGRTGSGREKGWGRLRGKEVAGERRDDTNNVCTYK
jgi:hypothetical protein